MTQFTKNQHDYSKFRLKNFTNKEGCLYVYNLEDIENVTENRSLNLRMNKSCKNLYEIKDKNGKFINRNALEKYFSLKENDERNILIKLLSKFDNHYNGNDFEKIDNKNYISKTFCLNNKEIDFIIRSFITIMCRNKNGYMMLKEFIEENVENEEELFEKLNDFYKWIYENELKEIFNIDKANIRIYAANEEKSKFYLPDTGVSQGILNDSKVILLPLSSKYLIAIFEECENKNKPLFFKCGYRIVNDLNKMMCKTAIKYVYINENSDIDKRIIKRVINSKNNIVKNKTYKTTKKEGF